MHSQHCTPYPGAASGKNPIQTSPLPTHSANMPLTWQVFSLRGRTECPGDEGGLQVPSVWRKRLLMRLNASQQRCWSYLLQAIRLSDALVNIHPHHELSPMEWSGAAPTLPWLVWRALKGAAQLQRWK